MAQEKANYPFPYLIQIDKIGQVEIGYIAVVEESQEILPFEVKRTFWTFHTPDHILRGRHAHKYTEQVLFALSGTIIVTIETALQKLETFKLETPNIGLYLPPNVWRTMQYQEQAVQLVMASTTYQEEDYIRSHEGFLQYWK